MPRSRATSTHGLSVEPGFHVDYVRVLWSGWTVRPSLASVCLRNKWIATVIQHTRANTRGTVVHANSWIPSPSPACIFVGTVPSNAALFT